MRGAGTDEISTRGGDVVGRAVGGGGNAVVGSNSILEDFGLLLVNGTKEIHERISE